MAISRIIYQVNEGGILRDQYLVWCSERKISMRDYLDVQTRFMRELIDKGEIQLELNA